MKGCVCSRNRVRFANRARRRVVPPRPKSAVSNSRIPGFYKLDIAKRREILKERCELHDDDLAALETGGLDPATCDTMIENVVGRYSLPFGIGLNFVINGQDVLLPMVIEEPSVVAAASNAARMIRAGGGFVAEVSAPIMIGQVQLLDIADPAWACRQIREHEAEILGLAATHTASLVRRGGGPVGIESRVLSMPTDPDGGMVVVHLHIDVCDAMGANLVNTAAEGVASRLAEITGGTVGLRILSNLAAQRTVTVSANVPIAALAGPRTPDGLAVRDGIVSASRFAELDPYRAATHNKGIMNGVDAVLMATANDWRSAEAGAHAYAAQQGGYRPLAVWSATEDGLHGEMKLPMAVGTVGGALQVHGGAKLALQILGSSAAKDLAAASAAAGLANNLAALRALATEGIQKGHMALHSRIVERANKDNEDSP